MLKYLDKAAFVAAIGLLAWFVYSDIRDFRELNNSREELKRAADRMESFIESNKDGFETPPKNPARGADRVLSTWREAPSPGDFSPMDFYDR